MTVWKPEYGFQMGTWGRNATIVLFTSGARNFLDRLGVSKLLETGNGDSHGSLDAQHEFQVALVRPAGHKPWRRPVSIEDSRIILDILASMEGPNKEQGLSTDVATTPSALYQLGLVGARRENDAQSRILEIASRTYEITDDSPQEDRIIPCWNHETLSILGFFLGSAEGELGLDNVGKRLKLPR
jgi:hypothetical protein